MKLVLSKSFFFRISLFAFFALSVLVNCVRKIELPNPGIARSEGLLFFQTKPFTGILVSRLDAIRVIRETPYEKGILHGVEREIFENGNLSAERTYSQGWKTGVHRGWFPSGARRFHHEYKYNQYDGEAWEWYESGALYSYAKYKEGKPIGRKIWREDGTIYLNYIFPDGKAFGFPGAKLCRQVRGGKDGGTASL
ncbi:hypothetical protein CH373_05360 [Leptospira perolatii]|uniref:Membrane-binding protein n=1 Tax=Leptospira perolatii TaxID=2023191 RepID=A0A2M9ZQM8_9LEPT|nr:hypothetical protein [Leptospira perolatii]PJZ70499.1 hypothetical protein CH360_05780 [Leptospira perolatii]PJZ74335.1 hypothetical protein CH373_05360 [Leptospira perolatii]